jgi:hypothetical protein
MIARILAAPWPICPMLLFCVLGVAGCATTPRRAAAGTHLELQTVTHDWQTTYVYRTVPD